MAKKKETKKKPEKTAKIRTEKQEPAKAMVTVYIMGKAHRVPADATIMGAIEYAGYQIKRGAGCREGFCGACATVYRMPGDFKIYTGMACMTLVQDGMWLSQLPAIPAQRPVYDLDELKANVQTFQKLYPEIFRCVACNTCTKACPQDLEVMDYIQAAKRGDIEKVMDLSFDCLSCGLCAIRCPAEIVHYNVGILGRRLYGKYLIKKSEHLEKRIKEVKAKKYDSEYKEMMKMK
ncbi:MAG: 4Fe-4S dicluster domain-containing protein, partial [Candidatus Aminicenantes bacterium]|nr:4Fe-4S dicluster domain-containing protein [Candidatus Aminicenantes bacterium]